MFLKEIYNYNWNISPNVEITYNNLSSIFKEEQECHFSVLKQGFNGKTSELLFDCSFQEWITKLSKSKLCTVDKVLVSKHLQHKGFVLAVSGTLSYRAITLRKSQKVLTDDQKQKLRRTLFNRQ